MTGAEALAVLGGSSSIITIFEGIRQVYETAKNAQGLPQAFHDVAGRLPFVRDILASAKQDIEDGIVDEVSCEGVKHVVKSCEEKAQKLDEIFHKVCPTGNASYTERYYKAIKIYGKGSKVEILMKEIMVDVQLLTCEHGMKTATKTQQEQILHAIAELSSIPPSVPQHVLGDNRAMANNYGSGTQYNAQDNGRQYNSGGGTMIIGND